MTISASAFIETKIEIRMLALSLKSDKLMNSLRQSTVGRTGYNVTIYLLTYALNFKNPVSILHLQTSN